MRCFDLVVSFFFLQNNYVNLRQVIYNQITVVALCFSYGVAFLYPVNRMDIILPKPQCIRLRQHYRFIPRDIIQARLNKTLNADRILEEEFTPYIEMNLPL